MRVPSVLCLAAAAAAACAPRDSEEIEVPAARSAIAQQRRTLVRWHATGDRAWLVTLLADDLVLLRSDEPTRTGAEAIEHFVSDPEAGRTRETESVIASGRTAIERGVVRGDAGLGGTPYVTHWRYDDPVGWRIAWDAVLGTPAGPLQPEGVADTEEGLPPPAEAVSALERGDRRVAAAVRAAAAECGTEDRWSREVVEAMLAVSPDSTPPWRRIAVAGALAEAYESCGFEAAETWVRSVLDMDLPEDAYRAVVQRVRGPTNRRWLSDVAADRERDPRHRAWALEGYLEAGDPSAGAAGRSIAWLPRALEYRYRSDGLAPPYVRDWLPALLASADSREAVALRMSSALLAKPGAPGSEDVLRIVGTTVGAYPDRFSADAVEAVDSLLARLAERDDLAPGMAAALEETDGARRERRNHLGVAVRPRPLEVTFEPDGDLCVPRWSGPVQRAVEAAAPGLRMAPATDCRRDLTTGDLDGDGSVDAVVQGIVDGRTVAVAILTGDRPFAAVVGELGQDDAGRVSPAGVVRPWCGRPPSIVFPTDYVTLSYDGYTEHLRYDGERFALRAAPC